MIVSLALAIVLGAVAAAGMPRPPVHVSDWTFTKDSSESCKAFASTSGEAPDGGAFEASLDVERISDGEVSLELQVNGTDKIKQFNFDDFEGPDAPAADRKLVTINVQSPGREVSITTNVAGWYTARDSFTFSAVKSRLSRSDARRLQRSLTSEFEKITVTVRDSRDGRKTLRASFTRGGDGEAVRRVFTNCGRGGPRGPRR